ncbi:integrase family protein [Leptothrix cholodnii SP-6]|uniref:Integrase family protein n=1 Tax=Leptothrix cholodnii (strain ATCC 51168 / LMG 8142 / SP-6) TaxID=395495 RepID=B1XZ69_LEPCP|nr:integrase arm-type DNA-binding domain-containing protein [Leptothrix cholodnii]ACB35239.1 integrase family protein [Leptothrix cholodnii SP-6]
MATINNLTDTAIRKATPGEKPRKLADGGGLYLELQPSGARYWRIKYRLDGKENRLSLGVYPAVSLADARRRRDEVRALIAAGTDPSQTRKDTKAAKVQVQVIATLQAGGEPLPGTFEAVALAWLVIRRGDWAPRYFDKIEARLANDVFPYIGHLPVADVTPPALLVMLRRIEARGAIETARRVRETCSLVFRFAVAEGNVTSDPARDLAGALKTHTTRHIPAITDPQRFGELLRSIDAYRGTPAVRTALQLAALVFLRPGAELREAQWNEFDLDAGTWLVPAARMKRRKTGKENGPDHLVPLSRQAVALLRDLHPLTGRGAYLFPGVRHRDQPMSENTLNAALDAMGYTGDEHRAHGFRSSARTMLHERLNLPTEAIEAQLAHSVPDALGRAYNRTEFVAQRRLMMQTWADYLDRLRTGAQVVHFKGVA